MKKQDSDKLVADFVKDLTDICPHCDARTHFQKMYSESFYDDADLFYYIIFRCVPCTKLILKTLVFEQSEYSSEENLQKPEWKDKYPTENIVYIERFSKSVPSLVLEDFKEGVICLANECYKSSVVMFRRALQTSLLKRGADKNSDLIGQIKNDSFLTKEIKDWAHTVRIFGNWGAHPQEDNLNDVDEKLATETKDFIENYFNYVYIMPYKIEEARNKNKPAEIKK